MLSLFLTTLLSTLILALSFTGFRDVFRCFEIVEKAEEDEMALRRIAGLEVTVKNIDEAATRLKQLLPQHEEELSHVEAEWESDVAAWGEGLGVTVGSCLMWLEKSVCAVPHQEAGDLANWRVAWRWER